MAIKKSQLYSSIWSSCDELRGGMDASQYKDYVLVLLFIKYVSDKYVGQSDPLIDVPEGASFKDMIALKGDKEIGDKINKEIIGKIAEANNLKGVIDVADFNDEDKLGKGKEMQDRLSNLIAIFDDRNLDFSKNRADGDDILGDAYEYLMRHFATESGKSKGQFYTPAEVSRIMAKVIGIAEAKRADQTIYDPTCGSGSLLLKAADEAPQGVTIYGQEMDNATTALAKMNMILHDNPTAEVWRGNTLADPHYKDNSGNLKTFDFVVANPPFSSKAWSNGFNPAEDEYERFKDGVPPQKNGDFAFLLHILRSLKSTGKGAVILPHGVLFRGNAEAEIRKNIIKRGYIKGIIGLPANLFYGTGIPACIIVLDKENAAGRRGLFMMDASKGFVKDGNKNRLRHQDIHKIVDVFTKGLEITGYSRLVPLSEISDPKNDYNLNIPRYIDSSEAEDLHDIEAHLKGGIPNADIEKMAAFWDAFPSLKAQLFSPHERPGYSSLKLEPTQLKPTILEHPEFKTFTRCVHDIFTAWKERHLAALEGISIGTLPRQLIETLSEDLLTVFSNLALIDKYDVYQQLMSYWSDTMQDDVYLIESDGWKASSSLRLLDEDKNKKSKEKADLTIGRLKYKADLIPPALIVARYFAEEQKAIESLETQAEAKAREMEELEEEHGGEDGLLEEAKTDDGKLTKASVKARLSRVNLDADASDEREVLSKYLDLMDKKAALMSQASEAQKALDVKVAEKYKHLSEADVKTLVVHDKWLTTLTAAIESELNRVSQTLTGRIKTLAERYAAPLPELTRKVEELSAKVDGHLQKMGFVWK
jgi:type I restriction enzyme M protein